MEHGDLHGTQNERNETEHSTETGNENLKTRSVQQVEVCSCCGEEMTPIEVLESYLEQRIEQALEVCSALSVEYGNAGQLQLLGKIADSLVQAATLTEVARLIPEGENNG
jgi:hypothetical protein